MHLLGLTGRGSAVIWLLIPCFISCRSVHYLQRPGRPYIEKEHFVKRLPAVLNETSGLLYRDGRLWSFNDSGGEAVLYSFLPADPSGSLRIYPVPGAVNTDWEDIAMDDHSVYISDVGNNAGLRDTLRIYRVSLDTADVTTGILSVIAFSYPGKTEIFHDCRRNPFDSEALTFYEDSLWLFTKNRQDESSCIYIYPPGSGYYISQPRFCLDPGMLVTGSDIDPAQGMLWLIGYHHFIPVLEVYRLSLPDAPRPVLRIRLPNRFGLQTEGIACANDGYVYFTNEKSKRAPCLFRMKNPFAASP